MLEDETLQTRSVRGVAHGAVVVADDSLSNKCSEVVIVLPANTFNSDGDVCCWDGVITETDLRTDKVWQTLLVPDESLSLSAWGLTWKARKVLLSELNKLLVLDSTGTNEYHTVGSVVLLDVASQVIAAYRLDVLLRTKNCLAKRLSLESGCVKVVEDNLAEVLVNFLLLAKNNVTLALDCRILELGVLKDVAKDANSGRDVRVE